MPAAGSRQLCGCPITPAQYIRGYRAIPLTNPANPSRVSRKSAKVGFMSSARKKKGDLAIARCVSEALERRRLLSTIYVDASAPGPANGASWTNAYTNPQQALAAAVSGDSI